MEPSFIYPSHRLDVLPFVGSRTSSSQPPFPLQAFRQIILPFCREEVPICRGLLTAPRPSAPQGQAYADHEPVAIIKRASFAQLCASSLSFHYRWMHLPPLLSFYLSNQLLPPERQQSSRPATGWGAGARQSGQSRFLVPGWKTCTKPRTESQNGAEGTLKTTLCHLPAMGGDANH